MARAAWGFGYASEAARAALRVGFEQAGLAEIVSMTTELNVRSQAVMERIGMSRDPADDFVHPLARPAHLRRHVLYRLSAGTWAAANKNRGMLAGSTPAGQSMVDELLAERRREAELEGRE